MLETPRNSEGGVSGLFLLLQLRGATSERGEGSRYPIHYCFLGGFCMTSLSGGLNERAVAGSPSVTRFTHRSWIELNPSGIPRSEVRKIETTSPMFELIMYLMKA